jgi:hypothetical protein
VSLGVAADVPARVVFDLFDRRDLSFVAWG